MNNTLTSWLNDLEGLHSNGLTRQFGEVRQLAQALQLTKPARKVVIVGGTNGKGTTCNYLEALIRAAGFTVGTTVSPHLVEFNERIRVNGKNLEDAEVVAALEFIKLRVGETALSYFDWVTLAALFVFKERDLDFAILEVGLGGRLDTTNVVCPDICAITNVGLDHQHILGHTRGAIAREKAGILRKSIPLVYGEVDVPPTLQARVTKLSSPMVLYDRQFGFVDEDRIFVTDKLSRVLFTVPNADRNLVFAAQIACRLEIPMAEPILRSVNRKRLPGRFETMVVDGTRWIIDVAHNEEAVKYLLAKVLLVENGDRTLALFACFADKNAERMVRHLHKNTRHVVVTRTLGHRGRAAEDVVKNLGLKGKLSVRENLMDAIDHIQQLAHPTDVIVVTGSFDLISRVRSLLIDQRIV